MHLTNQSRPVNMRTNIEFTPWLLSTRSNRFLPNREWSCRSSMALNREAPCSKPHNANVASDSAAVMSRHVGCTLADSARLLCRSPDESGVGASSVPQSSVQRSTRYGNVVCVSGQTVMP